MRRFVLFAISFLASALGGVIGNIVASQLDWPPWVAWAVFGILLAVGFTASWLLTGEEKPPPSARAPREGAEEAPIRADIEGQVGVGRGITQMQIRELHLYPPPPAPPGRLEAIPPARQIPAPVKTFTGREREIQEMVAYYERGDGAVALISGIAGMGGVGKTQLAYVIAHRLRDRYPDAQILVEMGGTTRPISPQEALRRVIHAFQPTARLPDDLRELQAIYRGILDGKKALVLLDDAYDARQVEPLLGVPPGVAVIITSRRRFSVRGMRRWDIDVLSEEEAVELLRKLTSNRRDLTGDILRRIAGLCGRLPLALEVAGGYLDSCPDVSGDEYARRLAEKRLEALRDEDVGRDVAAVLSLSVERLEEERPAWARRWALLGALPPAPFDRALAAALWGQMKGPSWLVKLLQRINPIRTMIWRLGADLPRLEPLDEEETARTLTGLVRWNLVEFAPPNEGTAPPCPYRVHDLLRLCALRHAEERLGAEALEAARLRHALHVLQVARRSDEFYLQGGDAVLEGLALLDGILPHLSGAVEWAGEALTPRPPLPSAFAGASATGEGEVIPPSPLLSSEGRMGEGRGLGGGVRAQLRLAILLPDAAVYTLDLRLTPKEKIPWLERAARAAQILGDRGMEGVHLGNLGNAYAALGEVRRAIGYYEEALAIAREIGDRRGEGNALGNLGLAYAALGEVRRAIGYYEEALEIDREIGDRRGEGADLGNLGAAYYRLGEVRRAIGYYEEALAIAREIGDRRGEGSRLNNLGLAFEKLKRYEAALACYRLAVEIGQAIEDPRVENRLRNIEDLRKRVGEERFAELERRVAGREKEVVSREISTINEEFALSGAGGKGSATGDTEKL